MQIPITYHYFRSDHFLINFIIKSKKNWNDKEKKMFQILTIIFFAPEGY